MHGCIKIHPCWVSRPKYLPSCPPLHGFPLQSRASSFGGFLKFIWMLAAGSCTSETWCERKWSELCAARSWEVALLSASRPFNFFAWIGSCNLRDAESRLHFQGLDWLCWSWTWMYQQGSTNKHNCPPCHLVRSLYQKTITVSLCRNSPSFTYLNFCFLVVAWLCPLCFRKQPDLWLSICRPAVRT